MSQSGYSYSSSTNNWGYPLHLCSCCPYGYHIDLDFVRYCESICKDADRTDSIKRRRDRRRQRKSMEVLLGLEPLSNKYEKQPEPVSPILENHRLLQKQDSFDNVIDDFEKTFQRSKKKLSNNLPDVTAVSDSSCPVPSDVRTTPISGRLVLKRTPHRELVEPTSEVCTLTPTAFRAIREQMALSLERTRQLEEQIKQLPALKVQISTLEDENEKLMRTIDLLKRKQVQPVVNKSLLNVPSRRNRSNSFSCTENQYENDFSRSFRTPSTKDIGVSCSVLTRNVGVGNKTPSRKHASTATDLDSVSYADKWLGEKLKFMDAQKETAKRQSITKIPMMSKANQTFAVSSFDQETQTKTFPIRSTKDTCSQTVAGMTVKKDQGTTVKPRTVNFGTQKTVECFNTGMSDDTITDVNCDKCNVVKVSVAVGPEINDQHVTPVSLASLSHPRSKSFNMGESKLDLNKRRRSVSVQYQYKPEVSTKSSQYEPSNTSRSCQSSVKTHSKAVQYESKLMDSSTQFDDTFIVVENEDELNRSSVGTKNVGCNTSDTIVCPGCEKRRKEKDERTKKDKVEEEKKEVGVISRIPKPQLTPTSQRKIFRRQDTYKKIGPSTPSDENEPELSGLDLTKSSSTPTAIERVRENLKLPEVSNDNRPNNGISYQSISNPKSESILSTPSVSSKNRKKAMPSKEMQGAMKVLNDSLQKKTKLPANHRAVDIIQQEWFMMSGIVTANPLDVEDYLDAFEDVSSLLLDNIVNMTDASGNTAMHYAVSHGNFDVVSILLDSKVCDINKPNKAGYTSVMLVSLAEIVSSTHANVVRRLLQMADVNKRAKECGLTALILAASNGKLDMVKMLLEAGADINIQDDDGSTALMCAAEHGHIEIVKHLLSQPDCDSTITDVDGNTALKIAMEAEHRPIGVLLYAHERNLMITHGHKYKKKSSSPKAPSSPLSIRHSHSALSNIKK